MKVHFEWQADEQDGAWKTIAAEEMRAGPQLFVRLPWWSYAIAFTLVIGVLAGGWGLLRLRYDAMVQEAAFQIQTVIDLEAHALAQRDMTRFLAEQDRSSSRWLARQAACAPETFPGPGKATDGSLAWTSRPVWQYECPEALRAEVQGIELYGDVAWVQVGAGCSGGRRMRFYRRTDLGWKQITPQAEFWGEPVTLQCGPVTVQAHDRDLPYVEPLAQHIYQVADDVAATLGSSPAITLEVDFSIHPPLNRPHTVQDNRLVVASPWLSGIPAENGWDQDTLDELAYWTVHAWTTQFARKVCSLSAPVPGASAPSVGHDDKRAQAPSYVARWLSHDPSNPDRTYVNALLRVARATGETAALVRAGQATAEEARTSCQVLWIALWVGVDRIQRHEEM